MKTIALIDYGSGNQHSAARALHKAAQSAGTGHEIQITSDPTLISEADKIVLPGVGHFADCAAHLRARTGLVAALEDAVLHRRIPFLGICVGQQLLATRGLEGGETPGLGWISGDVARIRPRGRLPIPHVGWNELQLHQTHPVLCDLGPDPHVYFTHAYAYADIKAEHIAATTDYGGPIIAAVARDNIFATQFHPEKSQKTGLKLLANFVLWAP